jgi:hypothetical protein
VLVDVRAAGIERRSSDHVPFATDLDDAVTRRIEERERRTRAIVGAIEDEPVLRAGCERLGRERQRP